MVIVHITCCEGSKRFIVKAVWRSGSGFDDVAFIKFEFYFTSYIFLCGLYECLDCLTKWCEPFSFVNNLSQLAAKFLLGFQSFTIKDQLLKLFMCFHKDCSTRSLINTTGFHTYNTVLNDIDNADSVLAAKLVQFCDDLGNFHCLSI